MKKISIIAAVLMSSVLNIHANDNTIDGIFAWVNGSNTCYKLSEIPKVTYQGKTAILTLGDSSTPELTIELNDETMLEVTYGKYVTSGIEDIPSNSSTKVVKEGKYIRGGQLIIVKDGKQYSINGTEIK